MVILSKHKISAFSLVETLASLVIIMLAFSLSVVVFIRLMEKDKGRQELQIQSYVRSIANKPVDELIIKGEEFLYEKFTIEKKMSDLNENPALKVLSFEVYDTKNKKIYELKKVILLYE